MANERISCRSSVGNCSSKTMIPRQTCSGDENLTRAESVCFFCCFSSRIGSRRDNNFKFSTTNAAPVGNHIERGSYMIGHVLPAPLEPKPQQTKGHPLRRAAGFGPGIRYTREPSGTSERIWASRLDRGPLDFLTCSRLIRFTRLWRDADGMVVISLTWESAPQVFVGTMLCMRALGRSCMMSERVVDGYQL
jgi:hypothetical protein